jgi:1-acyl-sn-glycerol-3-phosphate acyltransferase
MRTLLARLVLRLMRWTTVVQEPIPDRCVVIAGPHTTNWDFVVMVSMARVKGVSIRWLGKDALFRPPLGWLMRAMGGLPVQRNSANGMVAALAAEFSKHDVLHLVVPAEGTRSRTEYWKSGFYRIALAADVPVVCAFVDGPTRTGGFGPVIDLTGNVRADMDKVRAFYATKDGLRPNRFGPVRLRDEESAID